MCTNSIKKWGPKKVRGRKTLILHLKFRYCEIWYGLTRVTNRFIPIQTDIGPTLAYMSYIHLTLWGLCIDRLTVYPIFGQSESINPYYADIQYCADKTSAFKKKLKPMYL